MGSVQVAPEGRLKILHLVVQQRTTGWPPSVVDEDVNGAEGFGSRGERTGQTVRLFEVQHQRLMTPFP